MKHMQNQNSEVPVTVSCEHGVVSQLKLKLPLAVEAINHSRSEGEPLWAVWLKCKTEEGNDWYVTIVSKPIDCKPEADILVRAFRALLASPDGEMAAISFIRHSLEDADDVGFVLVPA